MTLLSPGARYRELLRGDGIIVQPSLADPLSARIAEDVGIRALSLGGYAMGANRAVTEPLLSLEDVARMMRDLRAVTRLPVMVDAGAGWGEPMHVMHAVRTLERSGAAAVHIEDQIYPKRAHYHKGVEHVVPLDELLQKVRAALAARVDPDFVICARTDAMRTHGYAEGIRRARACAEAGADLVMIFPGDDEETEAAPRNLPDIPLVYVNSTGNDQGRGVYPAHVLEGWGWKVVYDSISVTNVTFAAVKEFLARLHETGDPGFHRETVIGVRKDVERTIGLEELYALEESTVER
ncbi:isocitrate lyase/PEP mutase family protein [Nonomuraea sp. K274]|uniref:Isocitrate lyase/PEP mutase family protein n=1 Tax=Nonomuraea cypriaca TaxID=1187855 RepID=A0A931AFP1_9ACTN|nr:isocitrate lyase/PEP mutase family protein [Nonomuraea cypriaca]MBF8188357.1 isocitrate lyase/PEP mutase family protein [Nonomuraea cypriaca]